MSSVMLILKDMVKLAYELVSVRIKTKTVCDKKITVVQHGYDIVAVGVYLLLVCVPVRFTCTGIIMMQVN